MSWIDVLIIVIFIYSVLTGFISGLILTLGKIFTLVISILLAYNYSSELAELIIVKTQLDEKIMGFLISLLRNSDYSAYSLENVPVGAKNYIESIAFNGSAVEQIYKVRAEGIVHIIAFFVTFFVAHIIITFLLRKVDRIFKLPILNSLNKIGGSILGFIKGVLYNTFFITILYTFAIIGFNSNIINVLNNSMIAHYFFIGYLFY